MTGALTEVLTACRSIMEDGWSAPWRWWERIEFALKGKQEFAWEGKKAQERVLMREFLL